MKKKLAIIDPTAPKPYDQTVLETGTLGGTEASVLRVAYSLIDEYQISILQSSRKNHAVDRGIKYYPYHYKNQNTDDSFDAVIVIRSHKILPRVRRQFPAATISLWLHCFPGSKARTLGESCYETGASIIGVSRSHCAVVQEFLDKYTPEVSRHVPITYIYNPVEVTPPEPRPQVDPRKLIFLSSPHKGLESVLTHFHYCRRRLPAIRLYVADPGYMKQRGGYYGPGVYRLNSLTHGQVLEQLEDSFCLFYPQDHFAETFGLVFAEANAYGVPVLTGNCGAAKEVIVRSDDQVLDDISPEKVFERLRLWYERGRPKVGLNPEFCLDRVSAKWKQLLLEKEFSGTSKGGQRIWS